MKKIKLIKRLFSFKRLFNFAAMEEKRSAAASDKRNHILEVAERLFATEGYVGTSVRDIAQTAGVNIAMISYYFGSKEKLLEAVFEMRTQYAIDQVTAIVENEDLQPLDKVFKLIDNYVDRMVRFQHFHKIMVREQISTKDDTHIGGLIRQTKKKNQGFIKKLIQDGQKKGVFKKNIDIPLMMVTMIGTVNQLISTQHYYRELNNLVDMPDDDFEKLIRKKLSVHLKTLFKAILTYEQ